MAAVPDRAALTAALQAEVELLTGLNALLLEEQHCLGGADPEALDRITAEKARQVERLAALAPVRAAFLQSHNLSADGTGMRAWLARQANVGPIASAWRELLALAEEARVLNQANGAVLGLRVAHNQAALSALHGASNGLGVYGPDGQNDFRPVNRELARA